MEFRLNWLHWTPMVERLILVLESLDLVIIQETLDLVPKDSKLKIVLRQAIILGV